MLPLDHQLLEKMEEQLRLNCPSPESDLIGLGLIADNLPDDEKTASIRRLVLDIDDLLAQARWHLGHALLIMETQPYILEEKPASDIDGLIQKSGFPTSALLLLRGYVKDVDRVFYSDLSTHRLGGTVAG